MITIIIMVMSLSESEPSVLLGLLVVVGVVSMLVVVAIFLVTESVIFVSVVTVVGKTISLGTSVRNQYCFGKPGNILLINK